VKKFKYILFFIGIFVLTAFNNYAISADTDKKYLLIKEFATDFLKSNNTLLQGIIAFMVVLIFAYSAKLFYERKYNNE